MNDTRDAVMRTGRFWPTVKALRALEIAVPDDASDDEAVVFVTAPEPTP